MEHFTPVPAAVGGLLIGIAAVIMLLFNGRILGVTGITAGVIQPVRQDVLWRVLFLASLAIAPLLYSRIVSQSIPVEVTGSLPALMIGGFLVGFGACAGSGCTSGHGVCGLGRLSKRSLVVTMSFMVSAMATVYVMRHVVGNPV